MRYKATAYRAYGSGAGYGGEKQRFWSGSGVAFSKSPKRAMQLACQRANNACGEGANWILILSGNMLQLGNKVILDEGDIKLGLDTK